MATTSDGRAAAFIHRQMVDAGSFAAIVGQLVDAHADVVSLAASGVEKLTRAGGEPLTKVLQLGAVGALTRVVHKAVADDRARSEGTEVCGLVNGLLSLRRDR